MVSLSWCQERIWDLTTKFSLLFFIIFRQLYVWCDAHFLMIGRVCSFQLLLGLAIAVFLRSQSRGTHDHISLFPFLKLPQPIGPRSWSLVSICMHYIQFSSYLTGNTLCFHYRDYPLMLFIVRIIRTTQIEFLLHRKHITSPLQRPTGKCCFGKQSLFIVRTTRNTQIQFVPHRKHITSPLQRLAYGNSRCLLWESYGPHKSSSYFTGNTLRLRYREQPVNTSQGNSRCLLWELYGTHKYAVWAERRAF
jgi:hypothetical protein